MPLILGLKFEPVEWNSSADLLLLHSVEHMMYLRFCRITRKIRIYFYQWQYLVILIYSHLHVSLLDSNCCDPHYFFLRCAHSNSFDNGVRVIYNFKKNTYPVKSITITCGLKDLKTPPLIFLKCKMGLLYVYIYMLITEFIH